MPTVNLITAETQGVDMQVNPLFLGREKVHSATNMTFEEGRLRTRPGFRYLPLELRGQFQGATLYSPSKGISFRPFAENVSALVTIVSGEAHVNDTTTGCLSCEPKTICGTERFRCAGDVHLFQAENYLILQSPATNTYWWEGIGCAEESPGIAGETCESYAYQPSIDEVGFTRPPCPKLVTITVLNSATGNYIPNAQVRLTSEFLRKYPLPTNGFGEATVKLHTGVYQAEAFAEAFSDYSELLNIPDAGEYFLIMDPIGIDITIRVIDEDSGVVLPGAFVELKSEAKKSYSGFTNIGGDVLFKLFPAEFKYVASISGYTTKRASLVVDVPGIYTIALKKVVIILPPDDDDIIIVPPNPDLDCGEVPLINSVSVRVKSVAGNLGCFPQVDGTPSPVQLGFTMSVAPPSCSACSAVIVMRVYNFVKTDLEAGDESHILERILPFSDTAEIEDFVMQNQTECLPVSVAAFVRVLGGPECSILPQDMIDDARFGHARFPLNCSRSPMSCCCLVTYAENSNGQLYVLFDPRGNYKPFGEVPPPSGYNPYQNCG